MTPSADRMTCRELVELVTDYLDGALDPAERARFEAHVAGCPGCERHLLQVRQTIAVVGALAETDLDPRVADELLEAFRGWSREARPGPQDGWA